MECSIPVDFPDYFSENGQFSSFGLKEKPYEVLLNSYSYGSEVAQKQISYMIAHYADPKDSDKCLQDIHDIPKDHDELVALTKSLRSLGY